AQANLDGTILKQLPAKRLLLGILDMSTPAIATPEVVAQRIRRALPHVPAERLVIAPDCGLKYLSRHVAYGKMKAMVDGTRIVRDELSRGCLRPLPNCMDFAP